MIRPFNILKDNQFFWTVGAENEKEGLLKTRKFLFKLRTVFRRLFVTKFRKFA